MTRHHPALRLHHWWGPLVADLVSLTLLPLRRAWEWATQTEDERRMRRLRG